LEYVDAGDLTNALASFASDTRKDESTSDPTTAMLVAHVGLPLVLAGDLQGFRNFIQGFNG